MKKEYPMQTVLELACAAQRINKDYIKDMQAVYADDSVLMYYKQPNKVCMLHTLGELSLSKDMDPKMMPSLLKVTSADHELATEIKKYYRRLVFAAIAGDNEFQTEVNSLLNSENIPTNKFGFIACLPSVYKRDFAKSQFEKQIRTVDAEYLGEVGQQLFDKDCEIISSQRSKNFEAWNIDAIIDNKMVSWMSKYDLTPGPAVIVKAKVKGHSTHWKHPETFVTRLNYVKAAQ
jgi:hypothetical protein